MVDVTEQRDQTVSAHRYVGGYAKDENTFGKVSVT